MIMRSWQCQWIVQCMILFHQGRGVNTITVELTMIAGGRVVRVENHVRRTTGSNMFRSGAFAALQVELMV